ncbi:hypothetical protein COLO4_14878 [Corchorus olitorius]|uniref:F-box domain-containing protein n=1 Tax=Corchorus olitorius TaxID=93759 RepID=A0A1R3JQM0_9ROSI|nr:hypothetical protein COLO4_14878 [Corchorus olitorius]
MSEYIDLPQDMLLEILVRVPAEDLVKFTAVCKSWNSLIKNPNFISTHLGKTISSSNSRRLLLFRLCSWEEKPPLRVVEKYSLRFDNEDVDEYKQLHFPTNKFRSVSSFFSVVGICNGLVCLEERDYNYILWNPVIRKAIRLPEPSVRFLNNHYGLVFTGFGFDSKNNDYKLLRFVVSEVELDYDSMEFEAEVYSLNANCWTNITSIAPKYIPCYDYPRHYANSFVNGAIHMLACDSKVGSERNLILAFDVSEQVFSEITLPDNLSNEFFLHAELLKYRQSSIVIMTWKSVGFMCIQTDLWVMKEYGVATSWTKDEQVFVARKDGIASLDIKTKHSEVFGVRPQEEDVVVDSYVESLVLLDKCCSNARWDVISMDEDDANSTHI